MSMQDGFFMSLVLLMVLSLLSQSFGTDYIVGESLWSIPPSNDLYTNWSSSHFFQTGDTLFFDFDMGFHNVMQVSRREYESCTANNPFDVFQDGPASVTLVERGVFYFICSVANYCELGQKLSVIVNQNSPNSAPAASMPTPSSTPHLQPWVPMSPQKPPFGSPSSSQAPTATDWFISGVDVGSASQSSYDRVPLGALCLVIHFLVGYIVF